VQRDAALAVPLGAGHLGPAQAAGALDLDALGPALHGGVHGPAHGPPERHPAGQLLGHTLRHELGVDLGALDLEDVEGDLLAGHLVQVGADAIGLGATAPDDDPGTGGVDVHTDPVTGALDVDLADAGVREVAREVAADRHVLVQVLLVFLLAEPA
jgi:hypothetical protein